MPHRSVARVSCFVSLAALGVGGLALTACDPVPPPACTAAQLHLSSAALPNFTSHRVFAVIVTNAGAAACSVNGFPGVSFLGAGGAPVGGSAVWQPASAATGPVALDAGASASALLVATVAAVWDPSACGPILHGTTLRVYPPGSTTALTTPRALDVCTAAIGLSVGPFQPGTNPAP